MPPLLSTPPNTSRHDADLRAYAHSGDAEAFRRLVERHLPTVQQAAMRVLGSGSGMEDDVAQDVFLLLARKARQLPADTILAAWLHKQAARRAIDIVRSESRRRKREAIADALPSAPDEDGQVWNAIMPRLDRELLRLPGLDQKIVALRFMERCSSDEAARRLGLTSAAVRKRLERALSKLRERLAGPVPGGLTATALTAYLSVPTAKAASASQVAAITNHCLSAAPASGASLATFSLMTKSQMIVTGSILLVGAGAFMAGRHSAPGASSTSNAVASSSGSVHSASGRDRNAMARGSRNESADFPATKEGRLALLRVILNDGDPVSRSQALERFTDKIDPREYQNISHFLSLQKSQTPLGDQAVAAAQQALFSDWARHDPKGALQAVEGSGEGKYAITQTIANVWATQDPQAALAWARSQADYPPQGNDDNPFLIGLVGALASQDPGKATGLLEELPSGFTRSAAMDGVISRMLAQGQDAATQWIDGLQDEKLKKDATNRMAEEMANVDPAQAVDWIVSRTGPDTEHSSMDNVFKQWTRNDSEEAKQHFEDLPSGTLRSDALAAIAETLSQSGGAADFKWVYEHMNGVDTDRGSYQAMFDRWTAKDPQEAIHNFEQLPQDAARSVSEGIVNRLTSGDDPEAGLTFVQSHFDRIDQSAMLRAVLRLDDATRDAVLDNLEAAHPGSTIIPAVRDEVTSVRNRHR